MAGITDLGNGTGFVYVTNTDGTSIVFNLINDEDSERFSKQIASQAPSTAVGQRAVGTLVFSNDSQPTTITVDTLTIDGVAQIASPVNIDLLDPVQAAAAVAAAMNSFTASGNDYTATSYESSSGEGTLVMKAPVGVGSSVNGDVVAFSKTETAGSIDIVKTDVDGGSDNTNVYDESSGYRFFINSNYSGTAVEGDLTNSVEITTDLIPRGLQSALDVQGVLLDAVGNLVIDRMSSITQVSVDTFSGAGADDLINILAAQYSAFSDGDLVVLSGEDVSRVTTVKETGNIGQFNANEFITGDNTRTIIFRYNESSSSWTEVARSTQQIGSVSDYRAAGFPSQVEGVGSIDIDAAPTVLDPSVDSRYQDVTGDPNSVNNKSVILNSASAVAGDEFVIRYNVSRTSPQGFNVSGVGLSIGLTSLQQGMSGYIIRCYYDGSVWIGTVETSYDLFNGVIAQVNNEEIRSEAISADKLDANLKSEVMTFEMSFESLEVGDMKFRVPFKCNVVNINASVSKLIEATDDATIVAKDDSLSVMTGGTITATGGSAIGTQFNVTPTANNFLDKDDTLTLTTSKTTAGGKVFISIELQRVA